MIITLAKADFSANNIGTLDSFTILTSLENGCTYAGPTIVNRGEAFSATITIADNYDIETDGVIVSMGGEILTDAYTVDGKTITFSIAAVTGIINITVLTMNTLWIALPTTRAALGVTANGTGRVSYNNSKRFSTANDTAENGILVPEGSTITIRGLASGDYVLRMDYLYGTSAGPNPASGSTTAITGLVGTASNYDSSNYFPLNKTEAADTVSVTNNFGGNYYFFFGFAGPNLTETINTDESYASYTLEYLIS